MIDCFKEVEDLKRDGYVFSQKLTDAVFGILNKFTADREKGYHESINFIRESKLTRSTDKIEIGYSEITDNEDKVVTHSYGVFVKAEDSPRKILYCKRQDNKNYEPHITRLLEEREELLDKLEKLTIFINTNKFFKELPGDKGLLLRLQFEPMLSYLSILDKRLEVEDIKARNPKVELELN